MTTDPAIYNTSTVQGEPSAPIEIDSNPPINLNSIPPNLQKNLIANISQGDIAWAIASLIISPRKPSERNIPAISSIACSYSSRPIPPNLQKNLIANLTGTMPTPRRQMIEDTGGNWCNTEHFDLETDTDYNKEDRTHRARVYLMERYIHPEDCSYPKVVFSGAWDCCKEEAEAEARVVARLIAELMVAPTVALISQGDIAKAIANDF